MSWIGRADTLADLANIATNLMRLFKWGRPSGAATEKEKAEAEEKKVGASVFTKEDESEFENLMRALKHLQDRDQGALMRATSIPNPHDLVLSLISTIKGHQADDLRYAVVKMQQVDSYGANMATRKKTHVGASQKGPERDEEFWEFVRTKLDTRFGIEDTRILYLIYLAELVSEYGEDMTRTFLIKKRVIKEKSLAEQAEEALHDAREFLKKRWNDLDDDAIASILGEIRVKELAYRFRDDPQLKEVIEEEARLKAEARLRRLRKERQGSLRKGDWIGIGILATITLCGIIVVIIKSA